MAKSVMKVVPKQVEILDLLQEARDCYANMQRSWFDFARAISHIRTTFSQYADSDENGKGMIAKKNAPLFAFAGDFKEYLQKDFPGVDYDYARKMCEVYEKLGADITSRLKDDAKYKIPAISSCYLLIGNKEALNTTSLRKQVLESKITYALLKEKLAKEKVKKLEKEMKEIDDEVVKAVEEDDSDDIIDIEAEDAGPSDEEIVEENLWEAVKSVHNYIKILNDNLPAVMDMIVAHNKKDTRLDKLFNDSLDLHEHGLTNLMDAIDKIGGKKK